LAALSRLIPRSSWQAFLVTPETLLRWHRLIVSRAGGHIPHRRPGRPPIQEEVRQLILRLARENNHWGYVRIAGELRKLGITVSATLVRNVLARAGIPSAPQRVGSSWRDFLRQQTETVLAADFFTVDTVWLRRLYVLFFVSIGTRRVEYIACTRNPDAAWMTQQGRNPAYGSRRPPAAARFLIHDRDRKFSRAFDAIFPGDGITVIRTPIQSPNANAHAERWVAGSALTGCRSSAAASSNTSSASTSATSTSSVHAAPFPSSPNVGSGTDSPPAGTLYAPENQRRDLLAGLLHEHQAAA
jgi:putative transposase